MASRFRRRAALLMAAVTVSVGLGLSGSAVATAADNTGRDSVRTCGTVTCSTYFSHAQTVAADQWLQKLAERGVDDATDISGVGAAGVGVIAAGVPALGPAALFLGEVIGGEAFGYSRVKSIVHHAATSNGCLRSRELKGPGSMPTGLYADHSVLCHSMG